MSKQTIIQGDSMYRLAAMEDNSVDAIVTDPPYGLSFMGKKWDYDVPSVELWKECLRVMKPGAFLLSFAGSRTYHRMAVNIEDAGFEIRDQIMWIYGSGFPKSHNIGKAIDKLQGNDREVIGEKIRGDVQKAKENGSGYLSDPANRNNIKQFGYGTEILTKGTSEWEGWGTALKPAHEPIVVARKPLGERTVALNVLKWGTGGINIDACRVGHNEDIKEVIDYSAKGIPHAENDGGRDWINKRIEEGKPVKHYIPNKQGRFPANIILDEEAGKILDEQSGDKTGAFAPVKKANRPNNVYGKFETFGDNGKTFRNDKGGASRFFYCAKASKSERNMGCEELDDKPIDIQQPHNSKDLEERYKMTSKNNHPTVKPIKLMEYLIKLVSREGAVVLDPFLGSGTTLIACKNLNRIGIGIEREEEYCNIAQARLDVSSQLNEEGSK